MAGIPDEIVIDWNAKEIRVDGVIVPGLIGEEPVLFGGGEEMPGVEVRLFAHEVRVIGLIPREG